MKTKINKAGSILRITSSLIAGIFVIVSLIGFTTKLIASETSMDMQLTEVEEAMVRSSDNQYAEKTLLNQALNNINKPQPVTVISEGEIGLIVSLVENEWTNAQRLEFAEQTILNNHLEKLSSGYSDFPPSSISNNESKVNLQLNEIEEELYAANRQESTGTEMLNRSLALLTSNSSFQKMVSDNNQTNRLMSDCCIRLVIHNVEYAVVENYRFESAEDELLSSALYSLCDSFSTVKYGDTNLTRDTEYRTDTQPSIKGHQDPKQWIPIDNPISAIKLAPEVTSNIPVTGSTK